MEAAINEIKEIEEARKEKITGSGFEFWYYWELTKLQLADVLEAIFSTTRSGGKPFALAGDEKSR